MCNFQPVTREKYRIGVPVYGIYEEVFNSESEEFGGCGIGNSGDIKTDAVENHGLDYSIEITLPPLGVTYYRLKEALPAPPKPKKKKSTSKMAEKKKAAAKKAKTEKSASKPKTTKSKKTTSKDEEVAPVEETAPVAEATAAVEAEKAE